MYCYGLVIYKTFEDIYNSNYLPEVILLSAQLLD